MLQSCLARIASLEAALAGLDGVVAPLPACALTLVTPVMRMTHLTLPVAVTPHRLLSAGRKQLAVCSTVW